MAARRNTNRKGMSRRQVLKGAAANAMPARVRAIEYQGTWVLVILEITDTEEFTANLRESVFYAEPVEVGDEVEVRWAPEDVHLVQSGG